MVLEKERLVQLFVTDLEKLVTEIDPSYWRDAIRQLYRTYVKKGSKEAGAKDVPDSMDEFARQREYMERSLQTLKKRAMKNEDAVKFNNVKKASENAMLIDELNALRRDKRMLEVRVRRGGWGACVRARARVRTCTHMHAHMHVHIYGRTHVDAHTLYARWAMTD